MEMSHWLDGFPVFEFSHTMSLAIAGVQPNASDVCAGAGVTKNGHTAATKRNRIPLTQFNPALIRASFCNSAPELFNERFESELYLDENNNDDRKNRFMVSLISLRDEYNIGPCSGETHTRQQRCTSSARFSTVAPLCKY